MTLPAQSPTPTPAPVTVELIADRDAIVPGESLRVATVLRMAPGWHTYWEYAGDAGVPTKVEWSLPAGFMAGPLRWPLPKATLEPGDLLVYAYSGEAALVQTLTVPENFSESSVTLRANVSWLMCAEICVPGRAEVTLTLPVRPNSAPTNEAAFAAAEARIPAAGPPPFDVRWERVGDAWSIAADTAAGLSFFPLPQPGEEIGHPRSEGGRILVPAKGPLRGGVLATADGKAWRVESPAASAAEPSSQPQVEKAPGGTPTSLWTALLGGLLGGLILNLMPCVLPVISLKVFGFVRQAGESRRQIALHGVAFAAGVYAWFLGLAAVIVAVRAAGIEATWAAQFQNPYFNLAVAALVLAFALNLFGVFEVALPGRASSALGAAGAREGLGGSFFQGVFATLLATPCTGPFLGSSLAFAFAQPAAITVLLFTSIATGMALPYLALAVQPGWVKFLPRPGAWMERVKQFMGFPLLAALIWLLFIIGGQRGVDGVTWALAFLLVLAVALWIYGAVAAPTIAARTRILGLAAATALLVGGGWLFIGQLFSATSPSGSVRSDALDGIAWKPYSKEAVERWLGEGKPVFIDFTADWCLTCKYNERVAINRPAVRTKIAELGIVPVRADWTNANPEITAALRALNRVGVPAYVLYPAGQPNAPIVLPELLTETIVLEALARAR